MERREGYKRAEEKIGRREKEGEGEREGRRGTYYKSLCSCGS
jgi:hypothetical protein